ncbi:MAG: flagellar assembly protein FliH [Solirubrobacteraceae bacterium]|nr:flagellar assembly protein FliH [Solirubrobacteraceae bacterium]
MEKPTSKVIRDGLATQVVSWSPPLIGAEPDDVVATDDSDAVEVTDVAPADLRRAAVSALPTAAELERLHKKAHDDGFERGRAEGFRYGHQEALETARAQIAERIALLDELLDALGTPFRRLDDQVEREVVSLVVAIVRQLVRREVRTDPGQIVGVVRESLAILPVASRNVRVVLNPEDAALVRQVYAVTESELTWKIVEDPVVARGGCRVVTETSQVDATLESRLAALIAPLLAAGRSVDPAAGEEG